MILRRRVGQRPGQQQIGVEPTFFEPRRAKPAVDGGPPAYEQPIEIDLAQIVQRRSPVSNLILGNYSNSGYLLAGLSGNRPGAVFYLKDVELDGRTQK